MLTHPIHLDGSPSISGLGFANEKANLRIEKLYSVTGVEKLQD